MSIGCLNSTGREAEMRGFSSNKNDFEKSGTDLNNFELLTALTSNDTCELNLQQICHFFDALPFVTSRSKIV